MWSLVCLHKQQKKEVFVSPSSVLLVISDWISLSIPLWPGVFYVDQVGGKLVAPIFVGKIKV